MAKYIKLGPALISPLNKTKKSLTGRATTETRSNTNACLFILKGKKKEGSNREIVPMDHGQAPQSKFKRICVFCGSNSGNRTVFSDAALDLGNELVCFLFSFSSSGYCWDMNLDWWVIFKFWFWSAWDWVLWVLHWWFIFFPVFLQVKRRIDLVYGGGSVGLMGLISQTVYDGGCDVLG